MSLSNLIKCDGYVHLDDAKLVDNLQQLLMKARIETTRTETEESATLKQQEVNRVYAMRDEILRDAEEFAEAETRKAMEDAAAMREQALAEIEGWWTERRRLDEETAEEARRLGFEAGYREGIAQAEETVRSEYAAAVEEAASVLEQAYLLKRQIIQEAEPFLVRLGTAIAEKIVQRQLTVEPEWIAHLAAGVLARRREKGAITLCVAPQHFARFQDAREELLLAIDSQAELQIVPDATVSDYGCVLRTEFGSVDARIDTQLKEIKEALQALAAGDGDAESEDDV